jgi:PRTRC genetic system protein C
LTQHQPSQLNLSHNSNHNKEVYACDRHPSVRTSGYRSITLPDPNPKLSPEEVKTLFAAQYPELATTAINGPEVKNGNGSRAGAI